MRDRQKFNTYTPTNGITVYEYSTHDPYVIYTVSIPVGSAHLDSSLPFGWAHFYEHMTFHRSSLHPDRNSFIQWVASIGGDINAKTEAFYTTYSIQVPCSYAHDAWAGLYSMIFEPIFDEDDISTELSVIASERQIATWYPGDTELSAYIWTHWISSIGISKQQLFGSNAQLSQLTARDLYNCSQLYKCHGIAVVVAGATTVEYILDSLKEVPVINQSVTPHLQNITWKQSEFHTKRFSELATPVYYFGAIYPLPNNYDRVGISFLLNFLTDNINGILTNWLRDINGWTYNIDYERTINKKTEVVVIRIPLQTYDQVTEVRSRLYSYILEQLSDKQKIHLALTRQIGQMTFQYTTLESIVEDAVHDIQHYDEPLSEENIQAYLKEFCSPEQNLQIFNKYFGKQATSDFCALPEKYQPS